MNKNKALFLKNIAALIAAAILILIDQLTKSLAVSRLKGKASFVIIKNILELQYSENRGAAFGILQNKQIGLVIVTILILAGLIFIFEITKSTKRMIPLHIVYILIFAGAVGNMIDRVANNFVVDFIYFRIIDFPNFNVADICVTCGCALLIILMLFVYKDDEALTHLAGKKEKVSE